MKMGKFNVFTSALLSSLLLLGCGGGDDDSASNGPNVPDTGPVVEQAPVSARDGFNVVAPDEPNYVDLSSLIESGTAGARVTDIYLESSQGSGQCGQVQTGDEGSDILGQGFNVTIEGAAICEYGYEVESVASAGQAKTRARAKVMVASSAGGDAILPPISIAMAINDAVNVTDIKAALTVGGDFPAGYTLSEDFSVLGDGEVTVDAPNFFISYAAQAEGVSRVVYALEGEIGGVADIKMGTVDYAVSDNLNNAPTARNFAYSSDIEINTPVDIDVSGYVGDAVDGDELQLVEVKSYTADVESKDGDDLSNKIFSFEASKEGKHYVSYMVSDQRGGFATAIVEVSSFDANQVASWTDIDYWDNSAKRSLAFSAPKTKFEIEQTSSVYQGAYTDNGYTPALILATFSYGGAQTYCGGRGRLPTFAEMDAMYDAVDPQVNERWPAGKDYITQDGSNAGLYSIEDGSASVMGADTYNVTCVDSGGLTLDVVQGSAVADGGDSVQLDVAMVRDTGPVANVILSVVATNNAVPDSSTYTTDENGLATIKVTSIKSGNSLVTVSYVEASGINVDVFQTVSFSSDIASAKVSGIRVIKDDAAADGVSQNTVTATLLDANRNPVSGERIKVSLSSDKATLIEAASTLLTDYDGVVEFNVTNTAVGTVEVTASYTSSLVGEYFLKARVYFTKVPMSLSACGIGVDDTSKTNAVGNCLKVASHDGKLFTGAPSLAVVDALGFTQATINSGDYYDAIVYESGDLGPRGSFVSFNQMVDDDYIYSAEVGGSGGQYDKWCTTLRAGRFNGRANWRRLSSTELKGLYEAKGNMFSKYGWATTSKYASTTVRVASDNFVYYSLNSSSGGSYSAGKDAYASCVSDY